MADTATGEGGTTNPTGDDTEEVTALLDRLEELTDTESEREQVRAVVQAEMGIDVGVFGRVVSGFDRGDLAEAMVGSVVFGIPMFVEGGTTEVGTHLAANPLGIAATLLFTVGVVVGILYVSGIQDVRVTAPILGVVPRRLAGVVGVAFLTAVAGMTVWGRVDWADPAVATAGVTVAFVPMAIGAALSDILPGT
ncbi:MAG: DUF2391 family protein [Haloferacaceae archaeon]